MRGPADHGCQQKGLRNLCRACRCRAQDGALIAPAQFVDLVARSMRLGELLARREKDFERGRQAYLAALQLLDRDQVAQLREALGLARQARPAPARALSLRFGVRN